MENLNIEAILTAGAAAAAVKEVDGAHIVVLPQGYRSEDLTHVVNNAKEQLAPLRQSGTRTYLDAASFVRAIVPHVEASAPVDLVYHIEPSPVFTAILNGARPGQPSHEDHRLQYRAPMSREWLTWIGNDGKAMNQVAFAKFIETNLPDIVAPDGATMLELALNFEAKKGVDFKSGIRLQNGQHQVTFNETIEAKAGQGGTLSIPDEILIGIPVFDGSLMRDDIRAKFRYRIEEGKLFMAYELIRTHKVLEQATGDLLKQIQEGTGLTAFKGSL